VNPAHKGFKKSTATPASMTMNATSLRLAATIGAMVPPFAVSKQADAFFVNVFFASAGNPIVLQHRCKNFCRA